MFRATYFEAGNPAAKSIVNDYLSRFLACGRAAAEEVGSAKKRTTHIFEPSSTIMF